MATELIITGQRKPIWGVVSVSSPFAGLVLGLVALKTIPSGAECLFCLILIISSAAVIGFISIVVALVRGERFWPFTLLGIILNGGPLLLFLLKSVR